MNIRMKVNRDAFARTRSRLDGLILSDGDKSGPLLVKMDAVARQAAKKGIQTQGGGAWAPLNAGYARWKAKAGYGRRMMVMSKAYRGREARQLERKFTLAQEVGHIARWVGGLRWQFGVSDDVAAVHEAGAGLPRRSVVDSIYAAKAQFVAAYNEFYLARVRQVTRHS